MRLIKKEFKDDPDILPVWFDPWRFEKEEHLAVISLLRTIRLSVDEYSLKTSSYEPSKIEVLKKSIELALKAFLKSTSLSEGVKGVVSTDIDMSKILTFVFLLALILFTSLNALSLQL